MSTDKKQHHTTPAMHLKRFTCQQSNGKVWTYSKDGTKPFASAPEKIGKQQYFYAVRKPEDGSLDNRLEDYLGNIESKAEPIYERILNSDLSLRPQERHDFAHFLALMYFRTPTMRRIAAEIEAAKLELDMFAHASHDFENFISNMESGTGRKLTQKQKEELKNNMLNPGRFEIEVPAERTLEILIQADSLTPIFEAMHWAILIPSHGFFITSDNAVFKADDPKVMRNFMGINEFKSKSVEVTFPLSPKKALHMSWHRNPTIEHSINRKGVDMFNEARACYAERTIYAHINHKKISRLIQKHSESRITFRLDGFGPPKYSTVKVRPPARSKKTPY